MWWKYSLAVIVCFRQARHNSVHFVCIVPWMFTQPLEGMWIIPVYRKGKWGTQGKVKGTQLAKAWGGPKQSYLNARSLKHYVSFPSILRSSRYLSAFKVEIPKGWIQEVHFRPLSIYKVFLSKCRTDVYKGQSTAHSLWTRLCFSFDGSRCSPVGVLPTLQGCLC